MKKYVFRKYNKGYIKLYYKEKKKLEKILPEAKIEHIGSTAVLDLGGKGIIDILVGVKNLNIAKKILSSKKYDFIKSGGDKNRIFLQKDYGFLLKRRVHLQLTKFKSKVWKRALSFRDRLKKSKRLREEYENIKKQAVKFSKGEGKKYREYKKKFIKKYQNE
jgi:GrpB-like predicted nucleotidyltransferase (UPF0157 family)